MRAYLRSPQRGERCIHFPGAPWGGFLAPWGPLLPGAGARSRAGSAPNEPLWGPRGAPGGCDGSPDGSGGLEKGPKNAPGRLQGGSAADARVSKQSGESKLTICEVAGNGVSAPAGKGDAINFVASGELHFCGAPLKSAFHAPKRGPGGHRKMLCALQRSIGASPLPAGPETPFPGSPQQFKVDSTDVFRTRASPAKPPWSRPGAFLGALWVFCLPKGGPKGRQKNVYIAPHAWEKRGKSGPISTP